MSRRAVVAMAALVTMACGEPEPVEQFPFRFEARSDGAPVEDATIRIGGTAVGSTDASGVLDVTLEGRSGRTLPLLVDCPSAHRNPGDLRPITLQHLRRLDEPDVIQRVRVRVECPPRTRAAIVLVRTPGHAGVPVLVDGTERARTDADGLAHIALRLEPHTTIEVALRTDHLADLLPRNPSRVYLVPDHDELFVFDQELTPTHTTRRRRRRRRVIETGSDLPERIR